MGGSPASVALAGSLVGVALLRDFLEHYYLVNPGLVVPYAVLGWFGLWVLISFLQGLKLAKIPVWESYASSDYCHGDYLY